MDYLVNYDRVVSTAEISPVVKHAAKKIMSSTYITPAMFFKSLSDDQIEELYGMLDAVGGSVRALKDLMLLSMMLSSAEGVEAASDDDAGKMLQNLLVWITCVSLERKGMVKVRYENMSFSEEFDDAVIVERVE
jgi:ribosomal protein S13